VKNLTFEVYYLRKFDFFSLKKCYFGGLLGPPKEFFDEIKRGQKSCETVPLKRRKSGMHTIYLVPLYSTLQWELVGVGQTQFWKRQGLVCKSFIGYVLGPHWLTELVFYLSKTRNQ